MHRALADTLDGEASALYDAMSELIRVYQFRDRNRTHCHGVSVTECYALEIVEHHGPLRLGELASRLHLEKSTMSRTVDSLQRKGLVERRTHQRDRRALQIAVTAAGRRLHERITGEVRQRYRKMLEAVPRQARPVVIAFLERLARSGIASASEGCTDGSASVVRSPARRSATSPARIG